MTRKKKKFFYKLIILIIKIGSVCVCVCVLSNFCFEIWGIFEILSGLKFFVNISTFT